MSEYLLLPRPRNFEIKNGSFELQPNRLVMIDAPVPQTLFFTARRATDALKKTLGTSWEIVCSHAVPVEKIGLTLRLGSNFVTHEQGYILEVNESGIVIEGLTEAGVFYGVATLRQILSQLKSGETRLPYMTISDYPDFAARGFMLDISRDKVPSMETLLEITDKLADWKINQLQLYIEHTFAYHQHPDVWANASPITGEEIMQLDAFCRERFIELVPNQNLFGHMNRWLIHPKYAPLAETGAEGWDAWGRHFDFPFSLNPTDPASLELVKSLLDEITPYFTSMQFNAGCDETLDIGQGKNKEAVQKYGRGKVYLYFLHKIYNEVTARGKTMQFWGDIIIEHPELIPELPKDAIALEWGYEAEHPFDNHSAKFAEAGLKFYVCPGTSSWNSIGGRTDNALANLLSAAENGIKHGASGYLITDWGDNGHWQTLPISYLGIGMGAAYAWALDANRQIDIPATISLHAFEDPTGLTGKVAFSLGNVYKAAGYLPHNGSALFYAMQMPLADLREHAQQLPPGGLDNAWRAIDEAMTPLKDARPGRPDSDLIKREFLLAERMLRHAVMRTRFALGHKGIKAPALYVDMKAIITEYEAIWKMRNRPGGLTDSVERLEKIKQEYA